MYLQRWHGWWQKKLQPSGCILCTPYNHAPCRFMQSHIRKAYACLAVTCTFGRMTGILYVLLWNGYRNKSQQRKSTLEKKILPPLQQGFDPTTFRSRVRRCNHWSIPAPRKLYLRCCTGTEYCYNYHLAMKRHKTSINPFTAMLAAPSLRKRSLKVPNLKPLRLFLPPSHDYVKIFLSKWTVLKADLL